MERSAIRDSFCGYRAPDYASLHPGSETTIPCVARRAEQTSCRSIHLRENISLYRNSALAYSSRHLAPVRGAYRDRHETRGELRWTLVTSARKASQGGKP